MHVVLRGLGPSFQHIRNGYAGAEKQDAATLERLLDSNDAMDSATDLHTAFAAHAPPASALNPSGRLLRPRPASAFDCLWCETNGNHFTEECRNMQRSKEQRKANRSQPKTPASKGKPQQAKAADAALAEFAGEASCIHSPSDLITNHSWNPDTGATCHMTPNRQWLTHYRAHWVPVRLGDNSVVWSEGVGVCWFEPMLQGSPAPLYPLLQCPLGTPACFQSTVSVCPHCPQPIPSLALVHSLAFSKDGQVLFQATVSDGALASS